MRPPAAAVAAVAAVAAKTGAAVVSFYGEIEALLYDPFQTPVIKTKEKQFENKNFFFLFFKHLSTKCRTKWSCGRMHHTLVS